MNKCKGRIVKTQHTTAATKNGLSGDFYMNISTGCVTLTSVESLREAIRWPIQHITKFKSEDLKNGENLLTLEASLFCGYAEGSYQFTTFHGRDLIRSVKDGALKTQYIIIDNPQSQCNSPIQTSYRERADFRFTVNQHNSRNLLSHPARLGERSLSTPNLLTTKAPEIPSRLGNALITEFSSVTESHSYLELLEAENHTTTSETRHYIEKIKMPFDDIAVETRRDSGFGDGESDQNNQSVNSKDIDENCNDSQTPPPLPPKKCRDSCKIVYMDYNERNTESLPPPLPERSFKKH